MTGDPSFSPTEDDALSPDPNLHITIEEVSQNSEHLLEDQGNDLESGCEELFEIGKTDGYFDIEANGHGSPSDDPNEHLFDIEGDETSAQFFEMEDEPEGEDLGQTDPTEVRVGSYPDPAVGLEFETYHDAYNFYNSYAKEIGFAIRVKSSWTKRNSKEKRGAVLCCNCEGFKAAKEANNSRRKETRTGCLAMVRLRLVDSNRWRIDEVRLEHNHSFDLERAQSSKSHKKLDSGAMKRKSEPSADVEVRTIKLYRTSLEKSSGGSHPCDSQSSSYLKLKSGDAQILNGFFSRAQIKDPDFFYAMDFSEEGHLRNVFWIGSRSRAAYSYFSDVVSLDTGCPSFETPLVEFTGINHHGRRIPLGCGLISDRSPETFLWLLRVWLTCLSGRPPHTIVTSRCESLRAAVAEVFPRAHHRLSPAEAVRIVMESFLGSQDYEDFRSSFLRIVYESTRVDEFEREWEGMIRRFGFARFEPLQSLYEDRDRWVPVFSRDTFFAGILSGETSEDLSFFHLRENTSLKEFLSEIHDSALENQRRSESLDDLESVDLSQILKTRSYFELQISQLYTKTLFEKFQSEIVSMPRCFEITPIQTPNAAVSTFTVKELNDGDSKETSFEVIYEKAGSEVRCNCGCFNSNGFLCRHALCVLSYNGVDEIPFQYILSRWRRDFKRLYVPDLGSNSNVDIANPVQWFDHLYRRAMQVVEEGMSSKEHYMVCWQAFKESLNRVRLVADNNNKNNNNNNV